MKKRLTLSALPVVKRHSQRVKGIREQQYLIEKYPTGHVDTIETAVLRAVRTGVSQASGNMAIEGMNKREWDRSEAAWAVSAAKNAAAEEEKQFKNLLEKAEKGDKITLDEAMENVVAQKPYSEILPLREKLSNRAVRKWYLAQDAKIPSLIDRSLRVEAQAHQAFDIRNQNRTNARNLMYDQEKRRELDNLEPNRSFEDLISDKMRRKGLSREEALEDILSLRPEHANL